MCWYYTMALAQILCSRYKDCVVWLVVNSLRPSKLTIIISDNGVLPGRRQAIIWTSAGILLVGALGTNFSEILIKICIFSLNKMLLKMSSGKGRPSCLGLNVLTVNDIFCPPLLLLMRAVTSKLLGWNKIDIQNTFSKIFCSFNHILDLH